MEINKPALNMQPQVDPLSEIAKLLNVDIRDLLSSAKNSTK